jgi:hypothetical protein
MNFRLHKLTQPSNLNIKLPIEPSKEPAHTLPSQRSPFPALYPLYFPTLYPLFSLTHSLTHSLMYLSPS